MIYCAEFGRLGGLIKKLFNSVLSAHRLGVYEVFGVCSSYCVRETLSGHDRQTADMIKSICLVGLADQEYIYVIGSHMSPSTYYIHSA